MSALLMCGCAMPLCMRVIRGRNGSPASVSRDMVSGAYDVDRTAADDTA